MGSIISSDDQNPELSIGTEGSRGASFGDAIEGIIDDTEELLGAVVAPDGLVYEDSHSRREVAGPILVAATGRRVVFVTADDRETDAGSLEYVDLASMDVDGGDLTLSTTGGVRCVLAVADPGPPLAHLRWIGDLRRRLVACRNDIELAAGEIRDHAEAMEWHGARDRYDELRERLDALVDAVQRTTPVHEAAIAPELTRLERRLECAGAYLSLRRAESKRQLARQLAEAEEFGQLGTVLDSARTHHDRARSHAAALERSDGFRFGEHREVYPALADLSRDLDELAAVAADIIESRREHARVDWNEGADLARAGHTKEAIGTWTDAVDHLERASELAEERLELPAPSGDDAARESGEEGGEEPEARTDVGESLDELAAAIASGDPAEE